MTKEQLFDKKMELTRSQIEYYIQHELFTWQWWLLIVLTFAPWLFWFWFRKKETQGRILLGGLTVGLLALVMDMFGTELGLWKYGVKAIPSLPPLIPYDLCILPNEFMFIQQMAHNNKQFTIYAIGVAALNAFVGEPILKLIEVYDPKSWQKAFSFPLYFLLFWLASRMSQLRVGWNNVYQK